METVTGSAAATQRLAEKLAQRLKGGEVLGLIGDLGSGKTTFVKGLAKGLGVEKRVISPTFVFVRRYLLPEGGRSLYHIDLYRAGGGKEVRGLGLEEIWSEGKDIAVIEWAEKIEEFLPERTMKIFFYHLDGEKRKIKTADFD